MGANVGLPPLHGALGGGQQAGVNVGPPPLHGALGGGQQAQQLEQTQREMGRLSARVEGLQEAFLRLQEGRDGRPDEGASGAGAEGHQASGDHRLSGARTWNRSQGNESTQGPVPMETDAAKDTEGSSSNRSASTSDTASGPARVGGTPTPTRHTPQAPPMHRRAAPHQLPPTPILHTPHEGKPVWHIGHRLSTMK